MRGGVSLDEAPSRSAGFDIDYGTPLSLGCYAAVVFELYVIFTLLGFSPL